MKITPLPLFDNLNNIADNSTNVILPNEKYRQDFLHVLKFLYNYRGSQGTFNSYRRDSERLLQWTWHIKKQCLPELNRESIEEFINFCQNPPKNWVGLKKVPRFLNKDGKRKPNPEWRPFIATINKFSRKQGKSPSIQDFTLRQGSIQEIFAILSTLFNFLITEEYVAKNPIQLIRQKSKFIRRNQITAPIRRLSILEWQTVIEVANDLATENPEYHERTYFILSLLFGMYLRISELTANNRCIPMMNNFQKDFQGNWWFTTVGKGNKERQIAVSDDVLLSLKRWRLFLGLSPLPSAADNSFLIPKMRGSGPMSDPAPIRRIVQKCFDMAALRLRQIGNHEAADNLMVATVHWLRHTGISEDVKIRPREHVRDDAGHSSSATTDRYIDVERLARHTSAKKKKLFNES